MEDEEEQTIRALLAQSDKLQRRSQELEKQSIEQSLTLAALYERSAHLINQQADRERRSFKKDTSQESS